MGTTNQLHRITQALNGAFTLLDHHVDPGAIESLAHIIYLAMSGEGRYYHTPGHALALCDPHNPVQTLAALFHDLVYFQIDQGFAAGTQEIIAPYLKFSSNNDKFSLVDEFPAEDTGFQLACSIFGSQPGAELYQLAGSNEFLSCVVMVKTLEGILPTLRLTQVACYIEATIPFRTVDTPGINPFEKLAGRLREARGVAQFTMSETEIIRTIQGAVQFANLDVENFYSRDVRVFLESTWALLPEFNPSLRTGSEYTLGEYRHALQAMDAFIQSLHAEDVLHEFRGLPPRDQLEQKLVLIRQNLAMSHAYLEIKLLSLAILEALAASSGGDAPVSSFLGDVHTLDGIGIKDFLPKPAISIPVPPSGKALEPLLESGIRGCVDFTDIKTSALASYVYHSSGANKVQRYVNSARDLFAGKINPLEFLHVMDSSLVEVIAEAVAQRAVERREKLRAVIRTIVKDHITG